MIDRFGPLPSEVAQLLKIMAIKVLCRRANVDKVEGGPKGHHRLVPRQRLCEPGRARLLRGRAGLFAKVRPDMRVVFIRDVEDLDERLKVTTSILRNLVRVAEYRQAA
jgi:transcription-repair coupling factor (superfamily II helicase)